VSEPATSPVSEDLTDINEPYSSAGHDFGEDIGADAGEDALVARSETPQDAEPASFTSESAPSRFAAIVPASAVGRRKEAVARVRIIPGSGSFTINNRHLESYFPNKVHQQLVRSPFAELEVLERYDVVALISGGGPTGQAGALRMGVARALNNADRENNRPALKKAGYLTRDDRKKESYKAGLKKARKAPQYSKR